MTLFLKRDTSADDPLFVICDMSGNEKYRVNRQSDKAFLSKRLAIADETGRTVAKIRRLPIAGSSTFLRQ